MATRVRVSVEYEKNEADPEVLERWEEEQLKRSLYRDPDTGRIVCSQDVEVEFDDRWQAHSAAIGEFGKQAYDAGLPPTQAVRAEIVDT